MRVVKERRMRKQAMIADTEKSKKMSVGSMSANFCRYSRALKAMVHQQIIA